MENTPQKKAGRGVGNFSRAFLLAGPLFGSGIQLAAAVVFFFFVGRWLDGKFGTDPWLMLLGALIGAGGGLYNFIRIAIRSSTTESEKSNTTSQ